MIRHHYILSNLVLYLHLSLREPWLALSGDSCYTLENGLLLFACEYPSCSYTEERVDAGKPKNQLIMD